MPPPALALVVVVVRRRRWWWCWPLGVGDDDVMQPEMDTGTGVEVEQIRKE